MAPELCIVRGGGDLATGIVWRLTRARWPVIVTELAAPLTVRRTVALSTAVHEGMVTIEGLIGRRCEVAEAVAVARSGEVAVVVSPELPDLHCDVVVDARLAKRNIDTALTDAELVVGIGPGFEAGVDCHAVVETMRGHHLGRVFWTGSAAPDTGTPGIVEGRGRERVVRAPADGAATWSVTIGEAVREGQPIGSIGGVEITAPFDGVARGLIAPGTEVGRGLKIGDVDPRHEPELCHQISDKALAIGGGVVEAVITWSNR